MKMTQQEQILFVNKLMDSIKQKITKQIDDYKIPENWDGIELRHFISQKTAESDWLWQRQSRARKNNYNNDVLVNNL